MYCSYMMGQKKQTDKLRFAEEAIYMGNNKMVVGVLVTIIGLVFSAFSFIYAALNPWNWNGIDGLLGSFLGTHMLVPFTIGMTVMIAGLVICFKEAYRKDK